MEQREIIGSSTSNSFLMPHPTGAPWSELCYKGIMKPIVYVTGCTGFIGKHLVEAMTGRFEVICISHDEIETFTYNNFHTFFYLSSYGNHYQQKDLAETYNANVHQLFTTLLKLGTLDFRNFIHISTSSISIDEQTMYSATKHAGELLVSQMAKQLKKRLFSVRPYSIFGEGEAEFRFIPMMVHKLVKGEQPLLVPEPIHDWVYICDFIDALQFLMHKDITPDKPVEIGTGVPRSNLEVFDDICNFLGKSPNYKTLTTLRNYDNPDWYLKEPEPALLDWEPSYGYHDGLRRTVNYYAK